MTARDTGRAEGLTLEQALARVEGASYILRLFVTGTTPASTRAVANLKAICEGPLKGRYELEVIDVYQQPGLAKAEQIIATPTLIKHLPEPLRRVIGDLSDTEKVLRGLDLKRKDSEQADSERRP